MSLPWPRSDSTQLVMKKEQEAVHILLELIATQEMDVYTRNSTESIETDINTK